jgi:hypothetical protein
MISSSSRAITATVFHNIFTWRFVRPNFIIFSTFPKTFAIASSIITDFEQFIFMDQLLDPLDPDNFDFWPTVQSRRLINECDWYSGSQGERFGLGLSRFQDTLPSGQILSLPSSESHLFLFLHDCIVSVCRICLCPSQSPRHVTIDYFRDSTLRGRPR